MSVNIIFVIYFIFQCTVTVTDNGKPVPKTDTTTLQINVNRLKYPTFSGTGTYSANLREDDPVGKDVVRVQAFRNPTLVGVFDKSFVLIHTCTCI